MGGFRVFAALERAGRWWILWVLCAAVASGAAVPLRLDASEDAILRATSVQVMAPTGEWRDAQGLFFGQCTSQVRLRVLVEVPAVGRWWWTSLLRTPESLRVQTRSAIGSWGGTGVPFSVREMGSLHPAVSLDLGGGPETLQVVASDPNGDVLLEVALVPDSRTGAWMQRQAMWSGWVLGAMSCILVLAAFLWYLIGRRWMVWYVAYVATGAVWIAVKTGWLGMLVWPESPQWSHAMPSFLSRLALGLFVLFLREVLELRRRFPRWGLALDLGIAWQVGCAFFALLSVAAPTSHAAILRAFTPEILEAPVLLLALGLATRRAFQGDVLAGRLVVSATPLVAAGIFGMVLDQFDPAGFAFWDVPVAIAGALSEAVLTSIVLSLEIHRRERSRLELERDFHRRLVERDDELRRILSLELHDDLGQRAAALKLEVERTLDGKGRVAKGLGELLDGIRALSHDLHPPLLGAGGLGVALEGLARELSERAGVDVLYSGPRKAESFADLGAEDGLNLFRIAQEAVSNALRHGAPTTVEVRWFRNRSRWILEVEDDGTGMRGEGVRAGLGMRAMRQRSAALGASLQVEAKPRRGVVVKVEWIGRAESPGPSA